MLIAPAATEPPTPSCYHRRGTFKLEVTYAYAQACYSAFSRGSDVADFLVPVQAAPITPLSAAAKPNTQDGGSTIQVRWGGWGWGWGVGAGIGALASAALIGAAIANSPYYYGGYYPYYGGYPYYGYGYPYGYSTPYYPSYSYGYYRPYRHYYVSHRSYWRNSYGMYRVRHYRHW